ncbi:MAG TPA: hypothetical protein VF627_11695 [Abditibacterium sp.]|jgi:tetratricopeptide (TPR) repeat protein
MKPSMTWAARAAFWMLALAAPLRAQEPAPPAEKPAETKPADAKPDAKAAAPKSKLEIIGVGELRIDGKVTAVLGTGVWQVETVSWTSPRGVTTDFDEVKNKSVKVGTDALLHPKGEDGKIALRDVKLGSRVGIIGKNGPDGALVAREVILLEGYGARKTVGQLTTNPFSLALVRQSRAAREAGQLPKALELADKAVATAQGMNDRSGEGLATQDKVLLHLDMGQTAQAFAGMKRIEALGRAIGNPLLLSMGLSGQGNVLLRSGEFERAITLLREADTVSLAAPTQIHLQIVSGLAMAYLASGDLSQGVATLGRVHPLEEAAGQEGDAGETLLLIALLQTEEKPDAARQTLTDVQPRIDRAVNERSKAGLLGAAGLLRWRLGEKTEAATAFTEAATLFRAVNDEKDAKRWETMATTLAAAPADWQGFWMLASGLGESAQKAKENGETPAE